MAKEMVTCYHYYHHYTCMNTVPRRPIANRIGAPLAIRMVVDGSSPSIVLTRGLCKKGSTIKRVLRQLFGDIQHCSLQTYGRCGQLQCVWQWSELL